MNAPRKGDTANHYNAITIHPHDGPSHQQRARGYVEVITQRGARRYHVRELFRDRSDSQVWRDRGPVLWLGEPEIYGTTSAARNNCAW